MNYRIVIFVLACFCGAWTDAAPLSGVWSGEASANGETTRLAVHITQTPDGAAATMTLPDIGVSGWPAISLKKEKDSIRIIFPSDSGPQTMSLQRQKSEMAGTWHDARFETDAAVTLHHHPDYKEPNESRVLIDGPAGKLGASLFMPNGTGPIPGVVFLHGSGPQPRDASRFAAQTLAEMGIASLIFDKRGVGQSEGTLEEVSFEDLAQDGIAAAKFLLSHPRVIRAGFFGHSQGGWIGPLAGSLWPETQFVISSAGPAVPPAREAEWDVVFRLRKINANREAEELARRCIRNMHHAFRTGEWGPFEASMAEARTRDWYAASGLEGYANRPDETFLRSYRAFMDYDPLPALRKLEAPLLAILAPDDESIDTEETRRILEGLRTKEGHAITVKLYPGYDHTMRRISADGTPLRFPEHPEDYFAAQAAFIKSGQAQ